MMHLSPRPILLAVLACALVAAVSACQLLDQVAPAANPAPGQSPLDQSPDDQSPADQSPRIRDPQALPPTWTPPPAVRSETPVAPETVVTVQAADRQATYTVQAGDTLAQIAIRFNVTMEALAAANGIEDLDYIEAGQVLVIPR